MNVLAWELQAGFIDIRGQCNKVLASREESREAEVNYPLLTVIIGCLWFMTLWPGGPWLGGLWAYAALEK